MAQSPTQDLTDQFNRFFRNYYRDDIGQLAQRYPNEQRSLYVEYDDLYQFDPDLAEDYCAQPDQFREHAEEALRLFDLPADVKLGQAHVRIRGVPDEVDIRNIRVHDDHVGRLVAVKGIVRKATDVRPKIIEAAFECQRCGTMTYIPQADGGFQEPHECQGCERQGPFRVNFDQSEFVDSQKLQVQESPEGLRGGETPQSIDVNLEDDVTGEVTPGDHVTVTGVLHIEQQQQNNEKSAIFDLYMDGVSVDPENEQFEDMDITEADKQNIIELASDDDIYDRMVDSIAPSIFGFDEEKLAMVLQLFSGVTKHLPDGSRIRGDLHMLLIGDPGTGKCVRGDTRITLADGTQAAIRDLVEANLDDPSPVDDGVYDDADIPLPTMRPDGTIVEGRASRVWKREAPDRMYRVRTESGKTVEVTPSHPLFVRGPAGPVARCADGLARGDLVATASGDSDSGVDLAASTTADRSPGVSFGTTGATGFRARARTRVPAAVSWDRIASIETVVPDYDWVYDLEVADTHTYLSNAVVSHNSQLLQYIRNVAPRSVYTSGKGSSSAGLTAAAVRDDFSDGQQWTLEAGALVLADKGIAAIDELDKMRCVTGDTLVHTTDGVVPIRELAHRASETGDVEELANGRTIRNEVAAVWTMDDEGRLVQRPVTAVHEYDAPETLYEVTLESGESVTATADHPFFVLEGGERTERATASLGAGDWVYVPESVPDGATDGGVAAAVPDGEATPAPGDSRPVPPAEGAILGYLAGDGNVYSDGGEGSHGVRFTNAEEQLRAHFETCCRAAFDADPVRYPSEQRDDGVGTVRLHGQESVDDLLAAGLTLETYEDKRVPVGVTRSDRETKAAFVRALADSGATVGERAVKLYSSSYELLLGTKMLLLEFGVRGQIQTRERDGRRDVYVLAITADDSLAAFQESIGFTLDRKEAALAAATDRTTGDRAILDVLPGTGEELRRLRESLRLHRSECGLPGGTYCDFETGEATPSLHRAATVRDRFERRREQAAADRASIDDSASWERLSQLRSRYHVSQRDLAAGTDYTQPQVSRLWGDDETLRAAVIDRLRTLLDGVAGTDLGRLSELVDADVRWRRVEAVEPVTPSRDDARVPVLERDLADLLGCPREDARECADELLAAEPSADSWDDLRAELDRHGVPLRQVADGLGVDGSTVSRWTTGAVDVGADTFEQVRSVAFELVASVRSKVADLREEVATRERAPKVYDLTVEGTHNFVANGMVVHNSEDRSAMHEALEQQQISVSKAGINATLKSRCSLLGAANPKYGRFDQYEPIGEQIDLEPALVSRFDLIFTVTDQPDPERDGELADHILTTNYAGELNTQREQLSTANFTREEVEDVTEEVAPDIDADLLRKYIAYAKRNCYPTMTDEARAVIRDFYVDLRAKGADENAPVPVTARKLEALVRLSEASARVRLSDTVEMEDAERVTDIVESCLRDIGVDPETGQFDADVVETGTSKSQRDRIKNLLELIRTLQDEYERGAPREEVLDRAVADLGLDESKVEDQLQKLRTKGDIYEPSPGTLRAV
jgi:replicative DNA helicase Mcm